MNRVLFAAALSLLVLPCVSGEDKRTRHEFEVRAVSYRAFPHENINASTFATCYGGGADSSLWTTMRLNCQTMTTPPPEMPPTNFQFIEIYNLVEANGSVYAITCKARWVGSDCAWLVPHTTFQAEVRDWTMWVTSPRLGDHGKDVRRKFSLLDVQKQPAASAPVQAVIPSGSYWGMVRSAPAGLSVRFGIAIRDENGSLNGCMEIQAPLYGSGAIHGTIKGKEISFDAVGPNYALKFRGELQGAELKGTYAVAPEEDDGAFVLRRIDADAPLAAFEVRDCLKTLISLDPPGPSSQ
jgi:hypothetical protein